MQVYTSKKKLFDDDDIQQRKRSSLSSLFEDSPVNVVNPKPNTTVTVVLAEHYRQHPLLKDKSRDFCLRVQEIDRSYDLNSSLVVVQFGNKVQKEIGDFLNEISECSNMINKVGLMGSIEKAITLMAALEPQQFTGKKKTGFFSSREYTVEDYINAFEVGKNQIDETISSINEQANSIFAIMDSTDKMTARQQEIMDELDSHLIAAKFILQRASNRMFKEQNEKFLEHQFMNRIDSLATFENVCLINFEQIKIILHNMIERAMSAQNIVHMTFPLWRSGVASLISKWQSKGVKMSTPISEIMTDPEFEDLSKQTNSIIQSLNKGNA